MAPQAYSGASGISGSGGGSHNSKDSEKRKAEGTLQGAQSMQIPEMGGNSPMRIKGQKPLKKAGTTAGKVSSANGNGKSPSKHKSSSKSKRFSKLTQSPTVLGKT